MLPNEMLPNEKNFRNILDEVQKNGRVEPNIANNILGILDSINRKNKMTKYLYELIKRTDFYKLYNWEKLEKNEGKIEHFVEMNGLAIHFSNKDDYYYLTKTFSNIFFSNLWSEINLSCMILNFLFRFPKRVRDHPYPHYIRDCLEKNLPTHDLTNFYKVEYSPDPMSWLYSLKELRNDFHHATKDIHEMIKEYGLDISSSYRNSFFIDEKYFGSSVPRQEREINFFCGKVIRKTEEFISEIYRILSDDLKVRNQVPLYDLSKK